MHPVIVFQEIIHGILQWQQEMPESGAHSMLCMFPSTAEGLQPHASMADYAAAMQPIYKQMQTELRQRDGQKEAQLHDPLQVPGEFSYKAARKSKQAEADGLMRFTIPAAVTFNNKNTWLWQTIISREGNRLLHSICRWEVAIPDEDLLYYEYQNLQDHLDELIQHLEELPKDDISHFMRYELSALWEEINIRKQNKIKRVGSDTASAIHFSSRIKVLKSTEWLQQQIKSLVDDWVVKYYHTAPIHQLSQLLDELTEQVKNINEQVQKEAYSTCKQWIRHIQIIILMIIIKKVSTQNDIKGLINLNKGKDLLQSTDEFLQPASKKPEDYGKLLGYSYLLDEADAKYTISRFPIIQDRMKRLGGIIKKVFSEPTVSSGDNHSYSDRTLPTAEERLRHDYFTFDQLVEITNLSEDALRKQFKRYGIKTIKRGDIVYIPYSEYTKKVK